MSSADEQETSSKKRSRRGHAFNPTTDMDEPLFRTGNSTILYDSMVIQCHYTCSNYLYFDFTGLVFESKSVLKAAINTHSIVNNRIIKYKKDDNDRARAVCPRDCTWILYATKEKGKSSFIIKTFRGEHTCPMVYKNKRVSSTYLAERYASAWRAEPNMSIGGFIDRVKKDDLGDISVWQVYRTKDKALEKIRGSVIEHYKVLWDYCEELKRTNVGTTAVVEGHGGEFKRLYICLGACKEGFMHGCRRLIGVDGCFLKTEYGGQLLSTVGVDGNNGLYPVAYAVVETENGENWRWFLELLKEDLALHNSNGLIFMSDKQKGLVNAIGSLFEHAEHRTCVRHLYNNFSSLHKGLALKNLLWATARATTIPQWLEQMHRICDICPEAYGWLELKPASQWTKSHFQEGNRCDHIYVDDIYKRDAYRRTYTPSISPITGPQAWPNPGLNPLTPPYYTKKAGRPKKSRRKEAGEQNTSTPTPEAAANATPSTSGNLSRKGLTMRCKKCGQAGHNKRSCKGAPPPATNM
ncbi:MuDR family transposase [Abeliophyllum distichum]|uniref:MuDR family transposase n=1 Tax=Abeliophyllum distichum TaxID=126358 RepID=A0ABD1NUJ2_9LAMI